MNKHPLQPHTASSEDGGLLGEMFRERLTESVPDAQKPLKTVTMESKTIQEYMLKEAERRHPRLAVNTPEDTYNIYAREGYIAGLTAGIELAGEFGKYCMMEQWWYDEKNDEWFKRTQRGTILKTNAELIELFLTNKMNKNGRH